MLVLEPIVWEDGTGGYRAEEVMLITDDGYAITALRLPRTRPMATEIRAGRPRTPPRAAGARAGPDGSP